jgi:hypothetical protein
MNISGRQMALLARAFGFKGGDAERGNRFTYSQEKSMYKQGYSPERHGKRLKLNRGVGKYDPRTGYY